MLINQANLRTLYVGFKTTFQGAFAAVTPRYGVVAMTVPSSTRAEQYGWLDKFPRMREWIGDRQIMNLSGSDYTIKNRDFESTISVDRNDVEDDNLGIYTPVVQEFGRSGASFPDELVWPLLAAGWTTKCYDGQPFFDTDHPVLNEHGREVSYANTDGGSDAPWFLLDDTRAIKPVIYQNRRPTSFVALDSPDDPNVFMKKKFVYGIDCRCNVGFSFPQLAWGSKQPLTPAAYKTARQELTGRKGDFGRPLGIRGTLLVVGPSNEEAARKLLTSDTINGGDSNPWKGTAKLEVVEWLP
ncbi:hypothetical protein D3093_26860 (plasmid) [Azospirillum argentinense]|uniref:Bacteriophage Mu GpT domain-containing protein n=1 Tax=Azospirillum argentinense TaxID=2970906 RepID=A0A4D8PSR4_9PROT|nr:Mu-like prophage major head subunit gpT family protein [Azospirillum argentinense]QCN98908.1 hypothetical protein D3093_26860 [Azospirillum argentinense]